MYVKKFNIQNRLYSRTVLIRKSAVPKNVADKSPTLLKNRIEKAAVLRLALSNGRRIDEALDARLNSAPSSGKTLLVTFV